MKRFRFCVPWVALLAAAILGHARAEHPKHGCPPTLYSPLHYWLPGLYRPGPLAHLHMPPACADRYPGIPAPQHVIRFPCRAVTPSQYYTGTGLAYDPLQPRPLSSSPAPSTLPATGAP